jgi:hypothetical protein
MDDTVGREKNGEIGGIGGLRGRDFVREGAKSGKRIEL